MVILCALVLAVIGAFVALAVTGREFDLSALIGLLMQIGIVVTNATVQLDLAQHSLPACAVSWCVDGCNEKRSPEH